MNRPIRRVAVVACLLFALLLGNSTYATIFRHHQLSTSEFNRRVRDDEFARDRGPIVVGNTAIADTTKSSDSLKYQRVYAQGPLFAPVTGFYSYDFGTYALERSHSPELAGTSDSLAVQRMMDALTGTVPKGATVETTLNAKAQAAAYQALTAIGAKGAVVALNPQTGAVLVDVSTPSYDPNTLATHDLAAANKAWRALTTDDANPMSNRAVRERYPPGSTFKIVVAAAALENGYQPTTLVEAPDSLKLPGTTNVLTNQGNCGNTKISLDTALTLSCNTAFAGVGMALGEAKIAAQAGKFGIGDTHLADLGGVASVYPKGMNKAQLAQASIGQFDVSTSPLQMAMIAGAIANDGVLMDPYLVSTVRGPDLQPIATHSPKELGRAMSSSSAKKLAAMMVNVVDHGSGTAAKIMGVDQGGKTGTAQHDAQYPYGWFVSFAPASNPTVALAVFIEDSNAPAADKPYAGASIAAPIARTVMAALLS